MIESDTTSQLNNAEELIKQRIFVIRGYKIMIDTDLAELYGVSTKRLNEQLKRNINRFPTDFMFKVTQREKDEVVANCDHLQKLKFSPNLPNAFTEHGVAMLSSVLNSETAIQMNILIIRVFIKIKELILSNKDLEIRVGEVEKKQKEQGNLLTSVHSVVKHLIEKPDNPKGKIGFSEN
jgi:hypothetical protein